MKTESAETSEKKATKTLVVYVTKSGAAREAANLIADTLRETASLEVDVIDLKKQPHPDLAPYANIVLGSGARMGDVYGEAMGFMQQDLRDKRTAIFVCQVAAGDPRKNARIAEKYITKRLARNPGLKVVSMRAFGGCLKIFGKAVVDRRDPAKVRAWAEELGKILTE